MDELIDVLTKDGFPTGEAHPKSIIHQKGLYHNTAHVWFYTKKGEILLSQRSFKKVICPGLWDVSVAGHVDANESLESAAIRETKEELGIEISPNQLHKIGTFECFQTYESGIKDYEFHNTYICELLERVEYIKLQEDEVENIKLVTIESFLDLLDNSSTNGHFLATNRFYYDTVIESIRTKLKI